MKTSLAFAKVFFVVALVATGLHKAVAQEGPRSNDEAYPYQYQLIPAAHVDALIENIVNGRVESFHTRLIQMGQVFDEPEGLRRIDREAAVFDPVTQSLLIKGAEGTTSLVEELRFFSVGNGVSVVHDIYLNPDTDLYLARGIPVELDAESANEPAPMKAKMVDNRTAFYVSAPAAQPKILSIDGVTNTDAGISQGLAKMPCGTTWNGYRVVNDLPNAYPWTIYGQNFGTQQGSVTLTGQNVQIRSWSPTAIVIDPTLSSYNAIPTATTLKVMTTSGASTTTNTSIVPSVRTRIYGQCTWWVADNRLNMGKQPSVGAYSGYTAMTAQWTPQVGDQLRWGTQHTAIIGVVYDPVTQSGTRSWKLTVTEYNSNCKNQFNSYTTDFAVNPAKATVVRYPKSSVSSLGDATTYYR